MDHHLHLLLMSGDCLFVQVLFNLKSTLNAAFYPDYDFSSAKSHEFTREPSFDWVQRAVNGWQKV